jgi:hypothetical protein
MNRNLVFSDAITAMKDIADFKKPSGRWEIIVEKNQEVLRTPSVMQEDMQMVINNLPLAWVTSYLFLQRATWNNVWFSCPVAGVVDLRCGQAIIDSRAN